MLPVNQSIRPGAVYEVKGWFRALCRTKIHGEVNVAPKTLKHTDIYSVTRTCLKGVQNLGFGAKIRTFHLNTGCHML
jgi:hypothetical protein